jgi:hypothetical protein
MRGGRSLSPNVKGAIWVGVAVVGVGTLVYFLTSKAQKKTEAARVAVTEEIVNSPNVADANITEGVRRELFTPSGAQSVRSATELRYTRTRPDAIALNGDARGNTTEIPAGL